MKNLIICGSSFLLPKNKGWQSLLNEYTLSYGEYGDLAGSLMRASKSDAVVSIIFLEDIVNSLSYDEKVLSDQFSSLFSIISSRCAFSIEPLVVCLGQTADDNVIKSAKKETSQSKIYRWFFDQLMKISTVYPNFYLIDLNKVFSKIGFDQIYDERNWYFAHSRLSTSGIGETSKAILKVLTRHYSVAAKVLVLDCDNTIWGGVIGEDGIDGIVLGQDGLGQAFVDFQREVKKLVDEGVLLVLASKNNEDEVWHIFDNHPSMIIKRSDIIFWRIDWNEKAENIRLISSALDLGIDSFVFWDDNPLERDKVRKSLPDIKVLDLPDDVTKWPELLRSLDDFSKFYVTAEDLNKINQYQIRAEFIRDKTNVRSEIEYLKSINLIPSAFPLMEGNISRAEQMCAKTNQYNLRTFRHSSNQLLKMADDNKDFCFLVNLKDNYGDHGLVALICLLKVSNTVLFIDTLLMSCRVLGRHLEAWILSEIIKRAKKNNFKCIVGEFIPTKRNVVAENFFSDFKFSPLNSDDPIFHDLKGFDLSRGGHMYILPINNETIPYVEIYETNKD